jgi:hypothetical protein
MIMWIDCGKRVENCMISSLEAPLSMCWCVEAGACETILIIQKYIEMQVLEHYMYLFL